MKIKFFQAFSKQVRNLISTSLFLSLRFLFRFFRQFSKLEFFRNFKIPLFHIYLNPSQIIASQKPLHQTLTLTPNPNS